MKRSAMFRLSSAWFLTLLAVAATGAAAAEPTPGDCPADLRLGVKRTLDGRIPADTQRGPYDKLHMQPVQGAEMLTKEAGIERVLALEAANPQVVPAGFREELAKAPRDAQLRLRMARCELTTPETVRRAGYDAALALLLGADKAEVLPLTTGSFYPDGPTSVTCTRKAECAPDDCDPKLKACLSRKARTASSLSSAELDIEDALNRTFVGMLTQEDIQDTRYQADNLVRMWSYGRLHRCGKALCQFTRQESGKRKLLVHWDVRYRGGGHAAKLSPAAQKCADATGAVDLAGCEYRCKTGAQANEAACLAKCAASCAPGP